MSGSLNKITLIGRVGKDPLSREMQSGGQVVTFSLATSETWTKDGSKQERTTWHSIVIFNDHIAKVVMNYVRKGSQIYIEGALQSREYDKDGVTMRIYEVVLQKYDGKLILLDSRNAEGGTESPANNDYDHTRAYSKEELDAARNGGFDDDIPFNPAPL